MGSPLLPLVWADFINGIYTFNGGIVPLADLFIQWPGYGDGLRVGGGLVNSYGIGSPTQGSYPIAAAGTLGAMQSRDGAGQTWSAQLIYNGLYSGSSDDFPIFGSGNLNHQRAFLASNEIGTLFAGGQELIDGTSYESAFASFGPPSYGAWDGSANIAMSWDGETFTVAQDGAYVASILPGENPLTGIGQFLLNSLVNPGESGDTYYYDLYTISKFTFFNSTMELNDNPINGILYASQFPVSSPYYNTASQTIVINPGIPVVIPAVPCCALDAPCECSLS